MAAGMGSRYGGLKQLDKVGPNGETIIDYSVYDAIQAGFNKIVFIIREDFKDDFKPNQVVGIKLTDYKNDNAVSIPSNIIYSDERGNYIFIVDEFDGERIARKLPILVGKSFDYKSEIIRGFVI